MDVHLFIMMLQFFLSVFFPYKYLAVIICENDHPIRRVFEEMVRRH